MTDTMAAPGARYMEINGADMVIDYGDVDAEVAALRAGVAVMDRSAWSRLQLAGRDRLDFIQRMSTNDFARLPVGAGRPTVFPDARGRMIDHVVVYGWEDELVMVGGLGADKRLAPWLRQHIFFRDQVTVVDMTAATGMLTLYGPQARDLAERVLGELPAASYFFAPNGNVAALVAGTAPLGGEGINLIAEGPHLSALWERLTGAGATPVGYRAFEALRIEAGYPAFGYEISEAYNPLEAGLLGAVSFTKGCYIGQEVVARLDTYQKLKQHLMGLRFAEPAIAAPGASLQMGMQSVGVLTSFSPLGDQPVGLGYVRASCAEDGATVSVLTPRGRANATLVALPGRWTRPYGFDGQVEG